MKIRKEIKNCTTTYQKNKIINDIVITLIQYLNMQSKHKIY